MPTINEDLQNQLAGMIEHYNEVMRIREEHKQNCETENVETDSFLESMFYYFGQRHHKFLLMLKQMIVKIYLRCLKLKQFYETFPNVLKVIFFNFR